MIAAITERPWFWWPIIAAVLMALAHALLAYAFAPPKSEYPRTAPAAGFYGLVRDAAKFTLFGSGAGLLATFLMEELAKNILIRDSLFSIVLISLLAGTLNYWMGASLDTQLTNDGKAVKLSTRMWEVVHGIIAGLSLTAMISLMVVIATLAIRA